MGVSETTRVTDEGQGDLEVAQFLGKANRELIVNKGSAREESLRSNLTTELMQRAKA